MDYLTVFLIISSQFVVFSLGLYIGKNFTKNSESISRITKNNEIIKEKNKDIIIDDKKIVLEIKTDKLEKKFGKIAEEVIVESDISSSVNKLKNMKGQ